MPNSLPNNVTNDTYITGYTLDKEEERYSLMDFSPPVPLYTVENFLAWLFETNYGNYADSLECSSVVTGNHIEVTIRNKAAECNKFAIELNSESTFGFRLEGTLCANT